jgi:hypothetical protein
VVVPKPTAHAGPLLLLLLSPHQLMRLRKLLL